MEAEDQQKYLQQLAYKIKEGNATDEDQAYFNTWYTGFNDEQASLPEGYVEHIDVIRDRMLAKLKERVAQSKKRTLTFRFLLPRISIAASILLCFFIGVYFIWSKYPRLQSTAQVRHDVAPGKHQATLTLANGQKFILTKGLSGKLAQLGQTSVTIKTGSAITYTGNSSGVTEVNYNTLSTAKGEQSPYPLILADGTKVWLDASSTITFPTAFTGNDRTVKITGQAYFEVVHNIKQPFKVKIRDLIVEDIGTEFNIKGYDDEPAVHTTLLSGSVKVNKQGVNQQSVLLKPGQDAVAAAGISVKDGDIEESIAWKNGYFRFNDANIHEVMNQLSRWYNVDVEYVGNVPDVGFNAHISRYKNISQVLKVLALTNTVHFEVEGRRVMVRQ